LCNTARHFGATLNWHRDPDYERRMRALRKDRQRIESEDERLRRETKRLKDLNSRLDFLLRSPDSASPTPPATDCG